ncbi:MULTISPECIES: hypothetical protein [Ralstonia solanacearum species complex]|uniref:Uncharacterized protein n=4 Tax=Ralstonia solanacearum species complex TaxID=3116862 RepID=A0AAD0WFW1_RALSL|nr:MULTISPECIES: hypothetical protein [Ralstonia solanacearum species complex]CCA83181.1 conserved hypothetical protein [blood disease bacterium R229]BEU71855.1 hypothetical protein MAFF211271_14100 [Ralstonia pseudosolanacearum]AMP37374.1 hypothetical protein LBM2029_07390 [Ralstonia solanacearum]AQW32303.1 hypothetical protein B0B51_20815 [blood disease bacterium A2-HR MARDI]AXV76784.1 hypothetical protein CJO76_07190 [Ralstonia solanacearum]
MSDFASVPPSRKSPEPAGFFQGGMMPATEQNITALLVFDVRGFQLTKEQGHALEAAMREHLFAELEKLKVDMTKRSVVSLHNAVFGISID